MVTHEQVNQFIGHKPFKSFKVIFKNGESIVVNRRNMAVSTPWRLVIGIDDVFRHFMWDSVANVEFVDVPVTTLREMMRSAK
jgi:hypothetical protein